ncbi:MAG: MaoC family dehydratase [Magnetovibrio sp.]|nr:MaoC family dehydratase [Magnetovibrio sp.]
MPTFQGTFTIAGADDWVGRELCVSDWLDLDQDAVTRFGELTGHHHWLHLDPARAAADGPYGGTIAQGFLMMDFILYFMEQTGLRPADAPFTLNYGLDKVRFLKPVPVGAGFRLRDRIGLMKVEARDDGRSLMTTSHTMEVDGIDGPVVYAEWLALWVPETAT